ncbi:MAG TPA: ribonuclease J, partial [Dissulfurispiraceae bacterium]|nr:ribonuclease J [Dissulfurispiraceae bacterium]
MEVAEQGQSLLIIPLGGVEEIGLNMTLFQCGDDLIIVDAGLMFPEEEMLGVDFVIPDFSYVLDNREKLRAVILTHGHEDHTGALPFLLKELEVPVYGTALTLALVREKLREHDLADVDLIPVRPRDCVTLGCFTVEFIRVTHSIVDGVGLGIRTPFGNIIHTGDFKVDPTPVDGELMDFHKFTEYGEKGTLVMLSDSTNAEKGGFTFSEKEVRRAFEDIFAKKKGRIIMATFASNIHRIQQAVDVAVQFGRRVVMCGKSITANAQIALDLGYLRVPENTWMRLDQVNSLPDDQVVIITTGSQGEPMSVMSRIAMDEHKVIKIREGDTVILSAKMIPGNERSIGRIIDHLMRRGADVKYEKVSEIHVSGHASKEELKLMMNLVRPR